jgi:two-component system, NarL family, nitrate/nitrite response regulator NarL
VTRILVVEDHRLVAQGLELGLRADGFAVRSTDGNIAALPALLREFPPDVVLLDLYLADGRLGIDLIPLLRARGRRLILLTGETDPTVLARAFEAGVDAVLGKTLPFAQMVREMSAIIHGRSVEAANRRHEVLREARTLEAGRARRLALFASLTPREEQVLAMLVDGVPAADIAEASYVSLSTVRSQIRSILSKLNVTSQLAAVSAAIKANWSPRPLVKGKGN